MKQTYKQVWLDSKDGEHSKVIWIPSELAVVNKVIEVKAAKSRGRRHIWIVGRVWDLEITFEDLSNQREARKDRAERIR